MQPIVATVGPLAAAVANNIATSQTPTAGPLTLNGALVTGGVAVMDKPRQVLITTTADEHTKTFVITGTDWAGSPISETVTGVNNGTVASVLSYATVSSITISANAAGALTVGTNGVASSAWMRMDGFASQVIAVQCTASGTVNYTVQSSLDEPNAIVSAVSPAAMAWVNSPDLAVVGATATAQSFYPYCPLWLRVVLNSGSGSVVMTAQQASSAPY